MSAPPLPARPPPEGLEWCVPPAPTSPPVLVVASKDGEEVSRTDISGRAVTTFGRNSAMSDVALDHPSLSRRHAAVVRDAEGSVLLVDLGSSHGTFLNGTRLDQFRPAPLGPSDTFAFGASTRTYRVVVGGDDGAGAHPKAVAAARGQNEEEEEESSDDDIGPLPPSSAAAPSSSSSSTMFVRPAAAAAAAGNEEEEEDAAARAERRRREERLARDAELRAAIASMSSAPVAIRHPKIAGGAPAATADGDGDNDDVDGDHGVGGAAAAAAASASSSAGKWDAADDDDDEIEEAQDWNPGAGGESGAGGGAPELPFAFGRPAKAARPSGAGAGGDRGGGRAASGGNAGASSEDDDDGPGPAAPRGASAHSSSSSSSPPDAALLRLPISHEVSLAGHSKSVTALALDPSGARLATGSLDYGVKLFDFGGMDRTHRPFRELVPQDGSPVHALAFSPGGDRFVVATGGAQVRVFDREGHPLLTTVKGDVYLADVANTRGHVASVTAAQFHPTQKDTLLTASADGSVRLWDLARGKRAFDELCSGDVIKFKTARGQRAQVTAAAFSPDGKSIVAAVDDGSVQLVHVRSPGHKYPRVDAAVREAHEAGHTSCAVFSPDGARVATRGVDGTVRVWDVRKMSGDGPAAAVGGGGGGGGGASSSSSSSPASLLVSLTGLPSLSTTANVAWSPDGTLLVVGTAAAPGGGGSGGGGRVAVFEVAAVERRMRDVSSSASPLLQGPRSGLDAASVASYSAAVSPGSSAVLVLWHPRLNQVVVGCGDGVTRVLYDPSLSTNGALLTATKAPSKRRAAAEADMAAGAQGGAIYLPNALPMYREDAGPVWADKRGLREEDARAKTALAARVPARLSELPAYVTAGSKRTFTEHYMQSYRPEANLREQDPQRVLQMYASKAAGGGGGGGVGGGGGGGDGFYLRGAGVQAGGGLAERTLEEEVAEQEEAKRKRGGGR
jgi:WD repeat-containing protein 70